MFDETADAEIGLAAKAPSSQGLRQGSFEPVPEVLDEDANVPVSSSGRSMELVSGWFERVPEVLDETADAEIGLAAKAPRRQGLRQGSFEPVPDALDEDANVPVSALERP